MNKGKHVKKLRLNKETVRRLEPEELRKAAGAVTVTSFNSRCIPTCGPESCLGICSGNCSFLLCV